jgi:hypothetical protein
MAKRVKERSVTDPLPLLDQTIVHDSDVGCRAAKADPSEFPPETKRLSK